MVTFTAKDYKNQGKWKEVTISGEEFIRRFLMHVPPKRFVRIRHYGLLSSRNKNKKLSLCRNLLGQQLLLLTRFVQPGKIETDANERAVIGKAETAFSFAPPSILSLTSCRLISCRFAGCSYETTCRQNPSGISGLLPVFPLKRSAYFLSLIYRQQKKIRNTKTVCL